MLKENTVAHLIKLPAKIQLQMETILILLLAKMVLIVAIHLNLKYMLTENVLICVLLVECKDAETTANNVAMNLNTLATKRKEPVFLMKIAVNLKEHGASKKRLEYPHARQP